MTFIYILYSVRISSLLLLLLLSYGIRASCVIWIPHYIILLYYCGFTTARRYIIRDLCVGIKEYHIISYYYLDSSSRFDCDVLWRRTADRKTNGFIYRRSPPCNILRPVTIYERIYIYKLVLVYICILFGDRQQIFGWNIVYHASTTSVDNIIAVFIILLCLRGETTKL